MKTVHVYPISSDGTPHRFALSGDAVVLHVDMATDPHWLRLWVEIPMEFGPEVVRTFQVYQIGQPIPDEHRYIGTAIRPSIGPYDSLAWHLYEHW